MQPTRDSLVGPHAGGVQRSSSRPGSFPKQQSHLQLPGNATPPPSPLVQKRDRLSPHQGGLVASHPMQQMHPRLDRDVTPPPSPLVQHRDALSASWSPEQFARASGQPAMPQSARLGERQPLVSPKGAAPPRRSLGGHAKQPADAGSKEVNLLDEVGVIKHQMSAIVKDMRAFTKEMLGIKESVKHLSSADSPMAGEAHAGEDWRRHMQAFTQEMLSIKESVKHVVGDDWRRHCADLVSNVEARIDRKGQGIQEQIEIHRREMHEGFEREKLERCAATREHTEVFVSLNDSFRTHHASVHAGHTHCLRPGCGKPTWNGNADDWCCTRCRDVTSESSLEFLKDAFGNLIQSVSSLQLSVKRLDEKPSFFTTYKTVATPLNKMELFNAVDCFSQEWSRQHAVTDAERNDFIDSLRAQADGGQAEMRAREQRCTEVQYVGARLWTSDHRLRGVALCNMLCHANRDDSISLLANGGIAIQKALNAALTSTRVGQDPQRLQPPRNWNHQTYRGSKIHEDGIQFFRDLLADGPGHLRGMYRTPAPVASSLARHVAESFVSMPVVHMGPVPIGSLVPVLFIFKWENENGSHNDPPCVHARYIDGLSALKGEEEMLLAAYSVFVVLKINEAIPAEGRPMEIVIRVCEDNRKWPEFLPLAKWH